MPESQKVDLINGCPEWETLDFVIAEDGEIALYVFGRYLDSCVAQSLVGASPSVA